MGLDLHSLQQNIHPASIIFLMEAQIKQVPAAGVMGQANARSAEEQEQSMSMNARYVMELENAIIVTAMANCGIKIDDRDCRC